MGTEMGDVLTQVVDGLEQASVDVTEELLRASGSVPPPTLHMLSRMTTPSYLGYVRVRRFFPGEDAAWAIAAMGHLPCVMYATRLVVVWEHRDLCTALSAPVSEDSFGLAVLDASMDEHTLRWHPALLRQGPAQDDGLPTAVPEWRDPVRRRNIELPSPVADLLAFWRSQDPGDVDQITAAMEGAGYRIRWTVPEAHEGVTRASGT